MQNPVLRSAFAALLWWGPLTGVRAQGVRVEVATLDGAPVYHWRVFKSVLSDDVDRALVLREFQRKGFKVPQKLVDEAVQRAIAGDADKFSQSLRKKDASMENFRRFTTEEIAVQAMLYSQGKLWRTGRKSKHGGWRDCARVRVSSQKAVDHWTSFRYSRRLRQSRKAAEEK